MSVHTRGRRIGKKKRGLAQAPGHGVEDFAGFPDADDAQLVARCSGERVCLRAVEGAGVVHPAVAAVEQPSVHEGARARGIAVCMRRVVGWVCARACCAARHLPGWVGGRRK